MNVNKVAQIIPSPLFDILISIFNTYQYKIRRAGKYSSVRAERANYDSLSLEELKAFQKKRLIEFIKYAKENSDFYSDRLQDIDCNSLSDLKSIPFLEKSDVVNNLGKIATIKESSAVVSYTGGTTGASMKVYYDKDSLQERNGYIDNFRSQFGYELGKKVAWFSGKNLLSTRDIKVGRFYKDDLINKIRFYSTFHITPDNAEAYFKDLEKFQPEYLVGFPSSVLRICKYAENKGLTYKGSVKVFFPTAETVTKEHRDVIGRVLGCKLVDQYASSEGAPFIFECTHGNLHIDITSGVFEVLDENGNDANSGELVVTPFATTGTPLIRYRVGDSLTLSDRKTCACGSNMPQAERIEGRKDDYVLSPTLGEVNLGNISNSTKEVQGIVSFQIEQRQLEAIVVRVVSSALFDEAQQQAFIKALQERLGEGVKIDLQLVSDIPVEKSGKFRIIKNYLKK